MTSQHMTHNGDITVNVVLVDVINKQSTFNPNQSKPSTWPPKSSQLPDNN